MVRGLPHPIITTLTLTRRRPLQDFLPDDNAIVLWSDFSNANAVADELVRLMNNKTAYEEKLRWKHVKKISDLNLGLRQLMGTDVAPKFHSQCQVRGSSA